MSGFNFWKYFDELMRKQCNRLIIRKINPRQSLIISSNFKFFTHQSLNKN